MSKWYIKKLIIKLPFDGVRDIISDILYILRSDVGDSVFCKLCARQNVVYQPLNYLLTF